LCSPLFPYTTLFRSTSRNARSIGSPRVDLPRWPTGIAPVLICDGSMAVIVIRKITIIKVSPLFALVLPLVIFGDQTDLMNIHFRSEEHTSELQSREN